MGSERLAPTQEEGEREEEKEEELAELRASSSDEEEKHFPGERHRRMRPEGPVRAMASSLTVTDEMAARCAAGLKGSEQLRCLVLKGVAKVEGAPEASAPVVHALIDSGASYDFVATSAVNKHGWPTQEEAVGFPVRIADGSEFLVKKVVAMAFTTAEGYTYHTRAYVMPLGVSCEVILGMTWHRDVEERGGVAPRISAKHREIKFKNQGSWTTLRAVGNPTRAVATAQAEEEQNFGLVSAAIGRKMVRELRAGRKKGGQKDTRLPWLAQLRTTGGHHATSEEQWNQVPLRAAAMSQNSRFTTEHGIELLRESPDTQHHLQLQIQLMEDSDSARVCLITAEDREELYPFHGTPDAEGVAKLMTAQPEPEVLQDAEPTKEFVKAVLAGRLRRFHRIKPADWARYGIDRKVESARASMTRLTALRTAIREAQQERTSQAKQLGSKEYQALTLGEQFWSVEFRERLAEDVRAEYDDWVIREELPANAPPNPTLPTAAIRMKPDWDGVAPYQKSRRMSPEETGVCQAQLQELLNKGYITPSSGPYGAPVMVIPKPHSPGKWRMVVDYRAINKICTQDRWNLPDVPTLLDSMEGARVYSTADLCSGFYNIPIYGPHQERTAMSTPFGSFEWRFMPMGLKNAPAIFQRNIQQIFADMPEVKIFVDDLCVGTQTVEENLEIMVKVMERMAEHRLILKGSKLNLFKSQVDFLGYTLSGDGLRPQQHKVDVVREWPLPKTVAEVRGFIGLCSFYRKFVWDFADIAAPLNDMLKKEAGVPAEQDWTPAQLGAFESLKRALTEAPVLALPNTTAAKDGSMPFLVQTDASGIAMGAVLMQDQGEGWQPIAFASRTFTDAERNYHTAERELRALVWATCEQFRPYVLGTPYLLQGDHRALATLMSGRVLSHRQMRWAEELQQNHVPEMQFVAGSKLAVPDALSRYAVHRTHQDEVLKPEGPTVTEELGALGGSLPRREPGQTLPPRLQNAKRARAEPEETQMALVLLSVALGCPLTAAEDPEAGWLEKEETEEAEEDRDSAWLTAALASPAPQAVARVDSQRTTTAAHRERLADNQDWTFNRNEFLRLQRRTGEFDVDAFADALGGNAQLKKYWTDALNESWEGHHVWANVPFTDTRTTVEQVLEHLQAARVKDASTSAVLVLPYFPGVSWEKTLLKLPNKECLVTYPAGTQLFTAPNGAKPRTRWPVQIWWFKRGEAVEHEGLDSTHETDSTHGGAKPRKATVQMSVKAEQRKAECLPLRQTLRRAARTAKHKPCSLGDVCLPLDGTRREEAKDRRAGQEGWPQERTSRRRLKQQKREEARAYDDMTEERRAVVENLVVMTRQAAQKGEERQEVAVEAVDAVAEPRRGRSRLQRAEPNVESARSTEEDHPEEAPSTSGAASATPRRSERGRRAAGVRGRRHVERAHHSHSQDLTHTSQDDSQPRESAVGEEEEEHPLEEVKTFMERLRQQASRDNAYQQMIQQRVVDGRWRVRRNVDAASVAENEGAEEFRLAHGLLWRRAAGRIQLVIPDDKELRELALRLSHDAPAAGHFGTKKTLARLQVRFWWRGMTADCKSYCASCQRCQLFKTQPRPTATELHTIAPDKRRWASINVDFVTGLPMTMDGNDAILTVTDRCSKMVHFIPLTFEGSTAKVVARLFRDHVWKLHGMPLRILSDRDPRFTGGLWTELCNLLGVDRELTTAYNPQANGAAERTNSTMETYLRLYSDKYGADWDQHLAAAEYAINDAVSVSTGHTPFVLNHGESPNTALDYQLQAAADEPTQHPSGKDFVKKWGESLRRARACQHQAQVEMKKQYDRKHQTRTVFERGDRVLLDLTNVTLADETLVPNKLRQRYHPFTITEVHRRDDGETVNYSLDLPRSMSKVHNVFHESKLRRYVEPTTGEWSRRQRVDPPAPQWIQGKEEFVVEKITKHRVHRGVPQWLVVWKGYDSSQATWQTFDHINGSGTCGPWVAYETERARLEGQRSTRRSRAATVSVLGDAALQLLGHAKVFRVLVLCSGTGSVEKAFHTKYGNCVVYSVDVNPGFGPTHCMSVQEFAQRVLDWYPPGFFHFVWASPPCTMYSVARTSKPREFEEADQMVLACIEIISKMAPTAGWTIENPVGHLRKRPFMQPLLPFMEEAHYCRYQDLGYRKPTNFWVSNPGTPLLTCRPGSRCRTYDFSHWPNGRHRCTAQSGAHGTQRGAGKGLNVYPVPQALLFRLFARMEDRFQRLAGPRT